MARTLSHSVSTAQRYYQAPTLSDTYRTYEVINEIIRGDRATSPSQAEKKGKGKEKAKVLAVEEESNSDTEEEERDSVMEEDKWESTLTGVEEVEDERMCSKGKKRKQPWAKMESKCDAEKGEEREEIASKQTLCTPLPSPRKRCRTYTKSEEELIASSLLGISLCASLPRRLSAVSS